MKAKLLLIASAVLVISGSLTSCTRSKTAEAAGASVTTQGEALPYTFQRTTEKKQADEQAKKEQAQKEEEEKRNQQGGQTGQETAPTNPNQSTTADGGPGGPPSSSTENSKRFGDSSYEERYNNKYLLPWGVPGSNSAIPGQNNTSPGSRQFPFSTAGRPIPVIPSS
jgi:hypothetical protein